jgi:hypothetical protein
MRDINGKKIKVNQDVLVPDPSSKFGDMWQHSFQGVVDTIREDCGLVTVVDGDGDCWDVEPDRLEVV